MTERLDVLVLGGGCAGLSLATHLAEGGLAGRRVAVLEARERYENDRTWCGWSVHPHRFERRVTHRWSSWGVRAGGDEVLHRSSRVAYEHLPADAFYAEARAAIDASADVELRTGVRVRSVRDEGDLVRVESDAGALAAPLVVDTRPPRATSGELLQHFVGWHVRTERPAFDAERVTLMDFDVPQSDGLHFVYVLPFAPDEALVEATYVGRGVHRSATYERALRDYIEGRLGARVADLLRTERGALPLASVRGPAQEDSPRIVRAGTAGGAVRPSTGYAFLHVQRQTEALARAILRGEERPRVRRRPRHLERMDRIFLAFLERNPDRAPAAFARLLRSVPPEPLARFLMETGSALDLLRVVRAMPVLPFLGAALATAGGRSPARAGGAAWS